MGFEPHTLGEAIRDTLVVANAAGGEYLVPLVGRCTPPKPQGPINVAEVGAGRGERRLPDGLLTDLHPTATQPPTPLTALSPPSSINPKGPGAVPFRNVFPREAEFTYSVDNPAFVLGRTSEKLGPKKATAIAVAFRPEAALASLARGGGGSASGGSAGGTPVVSAGGGGGGVALGSVARTGKLTVSCPKQTGCHWIYYLSA